MDNDETSLDPNQDLSGQKMVGALFFDHESAERAIHALKDAGFGEGEIGVAMRDRDAHGKLVEDTETHSLVGDGAASGMLSGSIVGGVIGLLIGLGSLAIPGVGPVIAGGIFASTATGVGIGAASGGLIGALVGLGVSDNEAKRLETGFRQGATVVAVNAFHRTQEAVSILRNAGGDVGHADTDDTTPLSQTTNAELR